MELLIHSQNLGLEEHFLNPYVAMKTGRVITSMWFKIKLWLAHEYAITVTSLVASQITVNSILFQSPFRLTTKKTPKLRLTGHLLLGIHWPAVDSHHKGVMRNASLLCDVFMQCIKGLLRCFFPGTIPLYTRQWSLYRSPRVSIIILLWN